jgi:hypothetical protein
MQPVFGFLAFTSGSYEGAIIRDLRLANELHRRGFRVVIYWMMETNRQLVSAGIRQRILCRGTRYQRKHPSNLLDRAGTVLQVYPAQICPAASRLRQPPHVQFRPHRLRR